MNTNKAAVALSEAESENKEEFEVLMKMNDNRYYSYLMRIFENWLTLEPKNQKQDGLVHIKNNLNSLQVRTCDLADYKMMDHTHKFFCLVLSHPDSHRRMYFLNYATMMKAVDTIVLAQGSSSRLENYHLVHDLPNLSYGDKFLA